MNQLTATTLTALLMGLLIAPGMAAESENVAPLRLSESSPPEVACWFWGEADFAPGGYKAMIDLMSQHTSFTLLTASFRIGLQDSRGEFFKAPTIALATKIWNFINLFFARFRQLGQVLGRNE